MQQPQPHFDMFKDMFTHGVLCLAKDGAPVWVIKVLGPASILLGHRVMPNVPGLPTKYCFFTISVLSLAKDGAPVWVVKVLGPASIRVVLRIVPNVPSLPTRFCISRPGSGQRWCPCLGCIRVLTALFLVRLRIVP